MTGSQRRREEFRSETVGQRQNGDPAPTFKKVRRVQQAGSIIPVYKAVTADLLTPVLAYSRSGRESTRLSAAEHWSREKVARYSLRDAIRI
jgi:hypothetical protein